MGSKMFLGFDCYFFLFIVMLICKIKFNNMKNVFFVLILFLIFVYRYLILYLYLWFL